MRKVTASAVILTALTGCSQSTGVPSTQWSFKVPSAEGITGSQVGLPEGSSSVVSIRSVGDQVGGEATIGRQMGPAFEQPEADTVSAKLSTTHQSGNKESSRPSAQAFSLTNDLSAFQTSSRPDPVAQVRAYLRSSSPTILASRMPYRSDVYLSSQPTSALSHALPTPIAALTASAASPNYPSASYPSVNLPSINLPPTDLSFTELSSAESLVDRSNNTSDYTGLPALNPPASDVPPSYTALSPSAYALPAYPPNTYQNADEANHFSDDGLPRLAPSVSSGPAAPVLASQSTEQVTEQVTEQAIKAPQPSRNNVSIGTAILRDIESRAADAAGSTIAETSQPQQLQQPQRNGQKNGQRNGQRIDARPSSSSDELADPPTLSRLTQTMPSREISPLVASFRASSTLPEQSLSEPASELPVSFQNQVSENQSHAPVLDLKPEIRSHRYSSPLLEGFDADRVTDGVIIEPSAQSAIYVPIATTTPLDSSAILVQTAIDSLNTEDSTSDFIENLAHKRVFSSVISPVAVSSAAVSSTAASSAALPSNPDVQAVLESSARANATAAQTTTQTIAQRIPLSSGFSSSNEPDTIAFNKPEGVEFSAFQKLSAAELAIRKEKARRAAVTLAAQQVSLRRQRLNWL
ncbi:MAG: hypothetical protein WBA76_06640 [Phormidesmis sp.]